MKEERKNKRIVSAPEGSKMKKERKKKKRRQENSLCEYAH